MIDFSDWYYFCDLLAIADFVMMMFNVSLIVERTDHVRLAID